MSRTDENIVGSPVEGDTFERLRLIDLDQLCLLFRVKKSWVYDAVQAGNIPVIRLGKHLRFREADLIAYLGNATTGGTGSGDAAA